MVIQRYSDELREQLINLWIAAELVVPQNNPERDIQAKLDHSPNLLLVALDDNKLIGSIMLGYEGHRGWLNYLAVDPGHRGEGLGSRLVEAAIEQLTGLGCQKVNLQVRTGNAAAIKFYENLGFSYDNVVSLGLRIDN